MITHAEMHLADADHHLEEVDQDPDRDDRDDREHLVALATASALASIASSLIRSKSTRMTVIDGGA